MNRKLISGIVFATLLATGIGSLSAQTNPDGTVQGVDLNTSLRLWLDASDVNGNGVQPNDGDPVTTWVNKASNYAGEDPTQGNADKRPVFRIDGGTQFGNKPILEFSKSNNGDFLQYNLPTAWYAPYTLFIVYQQTSNASDDDAFFSTNNDSTDTFQITYSKNGTSDTSDDGFYWRGNEGGTATELFFEPESITESKLYAVRHGGDSSNKKVKLYVNGSEEVSNGAARKSGTKVKRYRINVNRGGSAYQNSKIAEVILYDRALISCEIEQVNLYLGAKYGKDFSNIASNYDINAPSDNDVTGIGNVVTACSTPVLINQGNSGILQIDNSSSNDVPGEFLTVGHDAAGYGESTDTPSAYAKRIAQVWRVDEDGDLGTVNVSFDLSGLGLSSNAADFALLIDDNGTFDDATATTGGTFNGDVITFTGVDLNNADHVSLATVSVAGAISTIENYATDNSNPAPTVDDYTNAGVTGVTAENLDFVNQVVDAAEGNEANTVVKIQSLRNIGNSYSVINLYADDHNTNSTPVVVDYTRVGLTGVTIDNVTIVNNAIKNKNSNETNTIAKIEAVVIPAVAKEVIRVYADDNTQPAPTLQTYIDAGLTGVTAENLVYVNEAIDEGDRSDINTNGRLQSKVLEGIAKADAIAKINAYADDNTQPAPNEDDYADAGYSGVTAANLTEVNNSVGNNGASNVQTSITKGISIAKVNAFADDDTQPAPDENDYAAAGHTGVTAANLTEVNNAVGGNGAANIANAITEGVAVFKINAYADDDTQPAPDENDYTAAGYTGVTAANLSEVNTAVGGNGNANVQDGITEGIAVAKVNAFADDDTQPAPDENDYAAAGYTGVTAANLSEVNTAVGGNGNANVQDGITEGIAVAKVNAFADDDTQPAPDENDYAAAGYTGVTAANLSEVNTAVGGNGNANVQDGITEGIAVAKVNAFADDDTQPAPDENDYAAAGYSGVTAANLAEVNTAVGGNGNANVQDGITEGIAVAKVNAFADDDTQPAPDENDYAAVGYAGVTAANLAEVNTAVGGNGNANVQDGITEGIAVAKVNAFADDDTQPAPDENDYAAAGYSGVTAANLAEVNTAVGGNGNANVQDGITEGIAVAKVNAFADDDTQPAPDENDYAAAGYSGVTAANLAEVNTAVGGNGNANVQDGITEGIAVAKVNAYADDNTNPAPNQDDYTDAGYTGVTATNLTEVNTAVGGNGTANIQDSVNEGAAIFTIKEYVNNGGAAPTVADYTAAGISGVTAANLADVNAAALATGSTDFSVIETAANQAVTNSGSTAIITDYATGVSSTPPTVADYTNAGISGVTTDNLDEVNAAVLASGSDDLGIIQTAVTSGISTAIINDYADGGSTAPTVTDYANAGIIGVTADNLMEVNATVSVNGSANIQSSVTTGIAAAIINDYAEDDTNPAPSVDDYTNAGISGVTADNLDEVNAAVGGNGTANITDAVQEGIATAIVNNYAEDDTNPAPSVDDYTNAGISGVTADNLDEINAAVGGNGTANITDAIQEGIATAIVNNYAEDDTNPAPSVDDYTNAGISGVTADNLDEVNAAVGGNGTANITDAVQEGVATAIVNNYAEDDTNPAPSVDDYANAGISGVTADNLDEVNAAVGGNGTANITDAVQEGVATAIINNYAEDDTNPAPSVDDYTNAGISGVTADNLDEVNAAVGGNGTANITDAVQEGVATAIVNNYAEDDTNPAPSVDDYTNAGISGVTADNLDEVNAAVGGNGTANITDAVQEGVATAIVNNYAEDDTNPAPSVDDYTNAGISGVTADNLDEVNTAVGGNGTANITDAVQEGVATAIVNNYAEDDTNPAPSVDDYTNAGISGVTADNLDEVNAAVGGNGTANITDAVQEGVATAIVNNYAEDDTNPAPSVDDYTNAGISGVTADNLDEVNAAVGGNGTANITDAVQEGVATAIINNYAEDDTNPAPSVDDYTNAGISGITADNLDEVNAAVGGNGTANITDAVQEGVATAIVNNYAEDDTNPAPSVDDYTNAGISGVTADNLDEVNAAVGGNGTANITDAVQEGVATAIINNYAEDDTNPAPTVDDYANAGVTGVTAENLDEINEMVATLDPADITDISDIQNIVAEEAAGNVIGDFAGGTGSAPTEAQYDAAGIKGVNASNLDEINDFISNLDPSEVDTNAKIQAVVDAIIAGNIIEAFADDNMQTEPTVDDYITAGVTDVDATNIADVNAAIANLTAEDLDTVAEIQAIVDAVNNGTLSNGNVELEKFAMYPNPASNMVTINIAVEKVTVYNIAGQKVLVSKENSFDISSLTAGVYVVEIKTSKETGVRRLVKK